ncbi:peroxiredoxin-like family protein [Bacillus sp. X1(2014)]|uniref:peroxiredoxin-like family protein n=1 Tax=Bacillus sp. X1(2014) TaxID=1565991 RepID=UPI0011A601D7|nr:peroxiredoxin-like family protein [Bacillus sp. X1(2014)]
MLTQLRERYEELESTGYQVHVITPSIQAYLEQFVQVFGPFPYTIYGDPKRELYREMGHQTMPKWRLLLQAATAYLKHGSKAFLPEDEAQKKLVQKAMKTHDIYIQGGTWIYDDKGKVIWKHIDTEPADHASIDTILSILNTH